MARHYRFGRFEVRPTERMLLVDGQPATLGTRAFDVLLVLIEHRDRLVIKSELLDLVWPGLFVEENNLQVQVSALRRLLGPQAVVTIPGRGYRFALPLDDEAGETHAMPSQAQHFPLPHSRPLLGREQDLAALETLLQTHALVSIVGTAGIGKTVLALAALHARKQAHRDGAVWVELSAVATADGLPAAVAQAMALPASAGDPWSALLAALAPLQLLLVLDNAEHLLDDVARLVQLIAERAPGVCLLVTSQAALRVEGEHVLRLGGLSVPTAGTPMDEALAYGAVLFFAEQARAADHGFAITTANVATVISLCRQLDGMALAIRLAAARLPLLGLPGLEARLGDRLRMLGTASRGGAPRQQTLSAALDWSHGLLSQAEQTVFRHCGVFVGGFSLELAIAVCSSEHLDEWAVINALDGLVDRSLIDMEEGEQARYRLLECARDYARFKLDESGERDALRLRHAGAVAALMEKSYESYWRTPDAPWLLRHAPEIDNVRAALEWTRQQQPELALRLMGASGPLFLLLGLAPEARQHCRLLEVAAEAAAEAVSARYWLERSRLHWGISNAGMLDFAQRAAVHYRREAMQDSHAARGIFLALRCAVGSNALAAGEAATLLQEMIRHEQADWPARLRSQRLFAEISVYLAAGQLEEAGFALESLYLLASSAGLETMVSAALSGLATLSLTMGRLDEAYHRSRDLVSSRRHHRDNFVLHALATIAAVLLLKERAQEARMAMADFVVASRSRDWEWLDLYADLFALLAALEGRASATARLLGYADAAYAALGERDRNALLLRQRAGDISASLLDAAARQRLMAEGARMDVEAVCALAMAERSNSLV
jgi:predicted ATPase/DNA-binding winged helix-turn-helix (wHTH) protein